MHDVGPKTYARVYELMWRLKANTFWPAIEADRIVSMYAAHADQVGSGWAVLDGLGHAGASLSSDIHMASVDGQDAAAVAAAPKATWRFATVTTDDPETCV